MSSAERARPPRGVIKRDRVRLDAHEMARAPARPAASERASACASRVRLIQREGRPQAIEFTCRCGEVSLIELQYPEKP